MEIIVTGGLLAVLLLALRRQLALRLQLAKLGDQDKDRHARY
jgi:hypothetical protein